MEGGGGLFARNEAASEYGLTISDVPASKTINVIVTSEATAPSGMIAFIEKISAAAVLAESLTVTLPSGLKQVITMANYHLLPWLPVTHVSVLQGRSVMVRAILYDIMSD